MRLIIADDHRITREGIRMLLADHERIEIVGEVGNGEDLLALLASAGCDLVLLDLEMPGMGGLEAIPTIRSRHPDVGVVVLSMHDRPDFVKQAIASGAGGYLLKSASREQVIAALETVMGGGSYLQPDLAGPLLSAADSAEDEEGSRLTRREIDVLELMAEGMDTASMAQRLGVAEATVRAHVKGVFAALGVHSRAAAVAVALREGLIP